MPSVRPSLCPKDLRLVNKLGNSDSQGERIPHCSLPRRLPTSPPGPEQATASGSGSSTHTSLPGLASESREITTDSSKSSRVPRHHMEPSYKSDISPKDKVSETSPKNRGIVKTKMGQPERNSECDRLNELRQFHSSSWSTKPSRSAEALPVYSSPKPKATVSNTRTSLDRAEMVAKQSKEVISHTSPSSIALPGNRCLGESMGRTIGQCKAIGTMVISRDESPLESTRNAGSSLRITRSRSFADELLNYDTKRQSNSRFILEKRRWNSFPTVNGTDIQGPKCLRSISHNDGSALFTGQIQPRGRSVVTSTPTSRMAFITNNNRENISQMGQASDRPVRICNCTCGSNIRNVRCDRPTCSCLQRIQPHVELSPSVDIFSSILSTTSTVTPEFGNRRIFNCDTTLGQSFLEARSQEQSPLGTIHNLQPGTDTNRYGDRSPTPRSSGHDTRGMEMWGWTESLNNWSPEEKNFLKTSWRESSLKTYSPAWQKWFSWCQQNSAHQKALQELLFQIGLKAH